MSEYLIARSPLEYDCCMSVFLRTSKNCLLCQNGLLVDLIGLDQRSSLTNHVASDETATSEKGIVK